MNIYFITNKTASRVWRMLPQASFMASMGHKVEVDEFVGNIDLNKIGWADVIISEMVFDWRIINAIDGTKKKLIYEIDDLQEVTHSKHYAYKTTHGWQGLRRRFYLYYFMAKADGFIVTNERLKKRYKWLTKVGKKKKIFIFPNYLNVPYWMQQRVPNNSGMIRILWAGGNSHQIDLEYIKPVMERILAKYKNVKFVYMGYGGWSSPESHFPEYNHGHKHDLKGLPYQQLHMEYGADFINYPYKLAQTQCDIGIAPLVNNKFARYKTPIKAMEYGINHLPCVGSTFMYKDVIIDGVTGFLADNQEDFYEKLCKLIEDKELREKMGEEAFKHVVDKFDMAKHINKWRQIVEYIASQ